MSEKTMEQLQAEIDALQSQIAAEKAENDEVKRVFDEKNRTLTVTFIVPEKPLTETKSGNSRFIKQHYRYWSIPGTNNLKVKLDVIRSTGKTKSE